MTDKDAAIAALRSALQRYISDEEATIAKAQAEIDRQQRIIRFCQGKIRDHEKELVSLDRSA